MKRFVSMLLALCLAISLAAPAWAEAVLEEAPLTHEAPPEIGAPEDLAMDKGEDPLSGGCGATAADDVKWQLTQNSTGADEPAYTLTIFGSGAMKNLSANGLPWQKAAKSISKIVVEDGVTAIGEYAFYGLAATELTIGGTVGMIGGEALVLPKLSQITVNGENKNFETIDQVLFTQDGSTLICYPAARHAENYTVPQGVKRIEIAAFQNADVKNITIPDTVTQIGKLAFRECTSLTTVNIPDKIERIESQTFYGCAALTEIVIPASVKSIGDFAFSGTGLSFVVMPDSVENEDGYLFFGNKKLTHVYLSRGMGSLSSSTLYNSGLLSVFIPINIKTIAKSALSGLAENSVIYLETPTADLLKGTGSAANYSAQKSAVAVTAGGKFPLEQELAFAAGTLETPSKEGHTFGGWYENSDCSGEAVTSAAAGHTYYAKWTPNTYTIQFEGGAGTEGAMEALDATYGQPATLPASGFTKPGSDFMGWDTDAGADTVVYADGAQVENLTMEAGGTVTLYAVWKAQTPTVPDTAIALDKTELSLEPGQTAKLKATLTPADATYKYIFWTSSDEAVATVTDSGLVTAIADGTAIITAKSWYGNTATCAVTVKTPDEPTPVDPWPTEGLEGFVTRCYRVALGRDPDKAGHADWVRWLKDGTVDATSCAYGFVFSKEMNNKNLSDEDFVKTLYNLFMDRDGEPTGVAFWTDYLKDGHSREEVFYGFADSAEFGRIKTSYGLG